jgi:hypothetical protein
MDGRRGRDRMVFGFTTTYVISSYQNVKINDNTVYYLISIIKNMQKIINETISSFELTLQEINII